VRRFRYDDFPLDVVAKLKEDRTIAACIPARDEETTVGAVVSQVLTAGSTGIPLADEVIVVDDGSRDGTAEAARSQGAKVVRGRGSGKGAAMKAALDATDADLIVFLDADVENTSPYFLSAMVGPLLIDSSLRLVKATYRRGLDGRPGEGGRVTELVAKPLITLLFPELTFLDQPLSGECAGWHSVFEKVDFPDGYGVELATLVDVARLFGTACIAQVDLGERVHRNRPLSELSAMSREIMETAFQRAGLTFELENGPSDLGQLERGQVTGHGLLHALKYLPDGAPSTE
jgi:glucosyl-3-phosphoglycerate synthase